MSTFVGCVVGLFIGQLICYWSMSKYWRNKCADSDIGIWAANALRAVVELIQEKQKFLEETKGDIPMTNQQLGAREERTKLLAEIKQAIEKELG